VSLRTARVLAGVYLVVATIAVTWPGMLPAARARPFVLGLPFAFFWVAAWIGLVAVVLLLVDRVERRHRDGGER
jgi:hypothetical protein